MKKLPDVDVLRQLFSYDARTGSLIYKTSRGHIKAGTTAGSARSRDGYVMIIIDYSRFARSRLVWKICTGEDPVNNIDHINGITDDDRIENLRECDQTQNNGNQKIGIKNTSGFKGVSYHRESKKWRAYITNGGRFIHLGFFEDAEAAHRTYMLAAKKYFGEFARSK